MLDIIDDNSSGGSYGKPGGIHLWEDDKLRDDVHSEFGSEKTGHTARLERLLENEKPGSVLGRSKHAGSEKARKVPDFTGISAIFNSTTQGKHLLGVKDIPDLHRSNLLKEAFEEIEEEKARILREKTQIDQEKEELKKINDELRSSLESELLERKKLQERVNALELFINQTNPTLEHKRKSSGTVHTKDSGSNSSMGQYSPIEEIQKLLAATTTEDNTEDSTDCECSKGKKSGNNECNICARRLRNFGRDSTEEVENIPPSEALDMVFKNIKSTYESKLKQLQDSIQELVQLNPEGSPKAHKKTQQEIQSLLGSISTMQDHLFLINEASKQTPSFQNENGPIWYE
ncbi:hypothetical protein CANCADRAFT_141993 [Tortispora caseinolytica NRRL Y-17796]|uniref:Uncharacterized protein n=1 Tax=Tortispora caseinolytica NRRL Y-17796 TaxID=767744 RepID=A0A1E4TD24_9ASCO|nr:hypothetical protein CANCADRAFT_141993 [Tortispora caseinolytica NRRL Y-17796]